MFEPENMCEETMIKAAADQRYYPAFYREVLESTVYYIRTGEPENKQRAEAAAGGSPNVLSVQYDDGKTYLLFFSSMARLKEFVPEGAWHCGVKGREFFETTRGAELMLNPGTECCKLFTKLELAKLLDGTLFHAAAVLDNVSDDKDELKLVQPRDYPEALVNALSVLFKKTKEVRTAYLAKHYNPQPGTPAHYVIGLEVSGHWERVAEAACAVAGAAKKAGENVHIIPIGRDEMSEYLVDTEPFYTKKSIWPF